MANPSAGDTGEAAAAGPGVGPAVQGQQWYVDERDGFISWLLSEFAAANAIIDSLVHHLRATGSPGEYEAAVACIQQRRFNWNPVIHMQQYFSITEVAVALQQAAWRKQQYQQHQPPPPQQRKPGHFGGPHRNFTHHHRLEKTGEAKVSEGLDASSKANSKVKDGENLVGADGGEGGSMGHSDLDDTKGICNDVVNQGNEDTIPDQDKKHNKTATPKDFVANEMSDGNMVNVVEGLKLYEGLLDSSDITKLVSMSNELRTSGRRGELQGQTIVLSKRPMKGHGREMIQVGVPIVEGYLEDESTGWNSRGRPNHEWKVEAIPRPLEEFFDDMVQLQILNVKPDYCTIDFYKEGDYSNPHMWPSRYGRPVCSLLLTDCDMVFGRSIGQEHHADYKGSLKLSLAAGALLVMQGKSADLAKHAIPLLGKQRIILTFGKSLPKRSRPTEGARFTSSITLPLTSPWAQPLSSRPHNFVRHPSGPKQFGVVSTTGVLPAPSIRPHQHLPPNGAQPLFVAPAPGAPSAVSYPGPVPLVVAPPTHTAPRLPVPGTGVFLPPPGSSQSPPPHQPHGVSVHAETSRPMAKVSSQSEVDNGLEKTNSSNVASPKVSSPSEVDFGLEKTNGTSVASPKVSSPSEVDNGLEKTNGSSDASPKVSSPSEVDNGLEKTNGSNVASLMNTTNDTSTRLDCNGSSNSSDGSMPTIKEEEHNTKKVGNKPTGSVVK